MPSDRQRAREYHEEERTQQARIADESFRSTQVTEDFETWRQNPGRRDFEGVDTIPKERKKQRAERALETAQDIGLVDEFVEARTTSELPGEESRFASLKGVFTSGQNKLGVKETLEEEDRQETLAHEVGHAVDHGEWNVAAEAMQGLGLGELEPQITSERMLDTVGRVDSDDPDGAAEELIELSTERRGEFSESRKDYREKTSELFADFLGDAILMPRNTKARTEESREALAEELSDPIEELEPTREFVDRELPDLFLPDAME